MTDVAGDCAGVERVLAVLGRAWAGAVVLALLGGAERFSDIARAVPGVTDAVLSARLKELCARGLAVREVAPGPPVAVRYRPTDAGRALAPMLREMEAYGRRYAELVATWPGRS
ncbi:MAG: helix-turn-helix transcriptional regulator [Austwickia sp.]|jgi:DNA-binding HxlR family transcriptional regulator|nr:MAG: helix-turn-helix transcriptional regulator [Austwickia sp.]